MAAKISGENFYKRMDSLMRNWHEKEALFQKSSTLLFLFGRTSEDLPFSKTSAFFRWLVGYDLTDTVILVEKRGAGKVTFMVSEQKEKILKAGLVPVPDKVKTELDGREPVEVEFMTKMKGSEKQDLDRMVARLKAGAVGGVWNDLSPNAKMKEPHGGPFASSVVDAIRDETEGIKIVDCEDAISDCLLRKDQKDINGVKSSCSISDVVLKKFVINKIEEEANEGKKISPVKLGDYIDGYFNAPEKISQKLQPQFVESCYTPFFSSGNKIESDLTKSVNSSKPLDYSVIVCAVGARYRSLCSNVMRTVLINPTEETTAAYNTLSAAFNAVVAAIKPGVPLSQAYTVAKQTIQERDALLAEHLDPCVGHSIGYQFAESLKLTEDVTGEFERGMCFNLMLLFQNLNNGKHSMGLADTVLIGEECELLTKATKEGLQYDLEEKQEESDGDADVIKGGADEDMGKRKSRMREQNVVTSESELKMKQQENFQRLQKDLEKRAAMGQEIGSTGDQATVVDWMKLNTYPKGAQSFPNEATPFRLVVDQENESILIPVNGFVVPIHISLIKSVIKLDDTIRFTFYVPGKGKLSQPANNILEEQPNTVFFKEVVYQLKNSNLLSSIDRSIKEMKKRVAAAEKRKQEMQGLIDQDSLQLSRETGPKLMSLFARPSLGGKRVLGQLEAHKNGFRYITVKGSKLDILYNNVAHAFFQPAEGEMLVILHFNLRNPVLVGKKKTQDIQFVQETMEASSRLDSRRRNYGDADEIEEEQREKIARKKINRQFFKFCKDVEEFSKRHDPDNDEVIKFDFPSRELGFTGVPFKSNVLLQPTAQDCLVHLVEGPPFFVLSLDDVEVASFERVMFGLRQFDVVFVLKDYNKDPITINSIPVEALETLQEWLGKSGVLYYLNPQPYNWQMIMTEVRGKTLKQFLDEGGWSFLERPESEEGDKQSSEGGSENYEPEGSSSDDDESSFDEDDEEESGSGSDGDDDDEGSGSEEEEADWEALEKKAIMSDKKKWGGAEGIQKKRKVDK